MARARRWRKPIQFIIVIRCNLQIRLVIHRSVFKTFSGVLCKGSLVVRTTHRGLILSRLVWALNGIFRISLSAFNHLRINRRLVSIDRRRYRSPVRRSFIFNKVREWEGTIIYPGRIDKAFTFRRIIRFKVSIVFSFTVTWYYLVIYRVSTRDNGTTPRLVFLEAYNVIHVSLWVRGRSRWIEVSQSKILTKTRRISITYEHANVDFVICRRKVVLTFHTSLTIATWGHLWGAPRPPIAKKKTQRMWGRAWPTKVQVHVTINQPGLPTNATKILLLDCPPPLLLRYPTEKKRKQGRQTERKKTTKRKKERKKEWRKEKKERKAEIQKNRKKEILKENREKLSNKLNILGWEMYRKTNR